MIAPLRPAESLFTVHPYLTRSRSPFSPDEVTLDPTFVFNHPLPDVPTCATPTWSTLAATASPQTTRRAA